MTSIMSAIGSFNPNLVRLRLLEQPLWQEVIYGFNPNLVRLRLEQAIEDYSEDSRFNPNLVRLRPVSGADVPVLYERFQSQLGSIKTPNTMSDGTSCEKCFNPNLVRLRRRIALRTSPLASRVSIPTWFD